jgi:hypothetical protein
MAFLRAVWLILGKSMIHSSFFYINAAKHIANSITHILYNVHICRLIKGGGIYAVCRRGRLRYGLLNGLIVA